jgi:hypothetical protein
MLDGVPLDGATMLTRPYRWRRRSSATPDRPHRFEETNDPGLAAFSAGGAGQSAGWNIAPVAVTDNFIRKTRCTFCKRPREDPIHEVDE